MPKHSVASAPSADAALLDVLLGPHAPPPEALTADKLRHAVHASLMPPDQLADAQAALLRAERRVAHLRQRHRLENALRTAYDTLHDTFPASSARSAAASDDSLSAPDTSRLASQLVDATDEASRLRSDVLQHHIAVLSAHNAHIEQQRDAALQRATASVPDSKSLASTQRERDDILAELERVQQLLSETQQEHAGQLAALRSTHAEELTARSAQHDHAMQSKVAQVQEDARRAAQDESQSQYAAVVQARDQAWHEAEVARRGLDASQQEAVQAQRRAEQSAVEVEKLQSELEEARSTAERTQREALQARDEVNRALADKASIERSAASNGPDHAAVETALAESAALRDEVYEAKREIESVQAQLAVASAAQQRAEGRLTEVEDDLTALQTKDEVREPLIELFSDRLLQAEERLRDMEMSAARALGKVDGRDEMDMLLSQIKNGQAPERKDEDTGADIEQLVDRLSTHITDLLDELDRIKSYAMTTGQRLHPSLSGTLGQDLMRDPSAQQETSPKTKPAQLPLSASSTGPPSLPLRNQPNIPSLIRTGSVRGPKPTPPPLNLKLSPRLPTRELYTEQVEVDHSPELGPAPDTSSLRAEIAQIRSALLYLGDKDLPPPPVTPPVPSLNLDLTRPEPLDTNSALDLRSDEEAYALFCLLFPRATAASKSVNSASNRPAPPPSPGAPKTKNARFAALAAQFESNAAPSPPITPRSPRPSASTDMPSSPTGTTGMLRWTAVTPHITELIQRVMRAEAAVNALQEHWRAYTASLHAIAPRRGSSLAEIHAALNRIDSMLDDKAAWACSLRTPSTAAPFSLSPLPSPSPSPSPMRSASSRLWPEEVSSSPVDSSMPRSSIPFPTGGMSPTRSQNGGLPSTPSPERGLAPRRRALTLSAATKGPMTPSRRKQGRKPSTPARPTALPPSRPSTPSRPGFRTVTLGMDPVALSMRVKELERELQELQRQAHSSRTAQISSELADARQDADRVRAESGAIREAMESQVSGLLEELNEMQSHLASVQARAQEEEKMRLAWQDKYAQLLDAQADTAQLGAPHPLAHPKLPPLPAAQSNASSNVSTNLNPKPEANSAFPPAKPPVLDASLVPPALPDSVYEAPPPLPSRSQSLRWLARAP